MLNLGERTLEIAAAFSPRHADDEAFEGAQLPYLPLDRIRDWDLRYEDVLEQLIYMQNLLVEE